jgi:ankyrin repeat protein
MHVAAEYGHIDVINFFIAHRLSAGTKDGTGMTPADYALENRHQEAFALLQSTEGAE